MHQLWAPPGRSSTIQGVPSSISLSARCKVPSKWACAQEPPLCRPPRSTKPPGSVELTARWKQEIEKKNGGCGEVRKVLELFGRPVVLSSGAGFFVETRCPVEETGMLSPANKGPSKGLESARTAALTLAELPPSHPKPSLRDSLPFTADGALLASGSLAGFAKGPGPQESLCSTSGGALAVLPASRGHWHLHWASRSVPDLFLCFISCHPNGYPDEEPVGRLSDLLSS